MQGPDVVAAAAVVRGRECGSVRAFLAQAAEHFGVPVRVNGI